MHKSFITLLLISSFAISQSTPDLSYREDQIYATFGYPLLINTPEGINQNKLSHAFSLGFIRDMPINQKRNFAFGLGLGLSYNVIYTNLQFTEDGQTNSIYSSDMSNQWNSIEAEIPLEFRWRSSSPTNYQFWRVYGGLVANYSIYAKQRTKTQSVNITTNLPINNLRLALRLNVGNNTWNLTYSYPIDSLFELNQSSQNESLRKIKTAKFGLIFYIF